MIHADLTAIRRPLVALLALVALGGLTGCELDQPCPAIHVPDVLALELDGEPVGDETWMLAVVVDGEPQCVLALLGDRVAPWNGACGSYDPWLASSAAGTTRIEIPDFTPEAVTLLLTIDGEQAGAVEGAPTYRTVEDQQMCAVTQHGEIELHVER